MKIKKFALNKRVCPVCSNSEAEVLNVKKFKGIIGVPANEFVQKLGICKECGMVYVTRYFNNQDLLQYYSLMSNYEFAVDKSVMKQHQRQMEFINSVLPNPHSVLDIGCAQGYLLGLYKQRGVQNLLGIDPSRTCAEIARKKYDVKVATGFFEKGMAHHKYNLVTLSHVIEHLDKPSDMLRDIFDILEDEGILFIETPDIELFNSLDPYYLSFEHINYFSFQTLKNLIERNGFKLIKNKVFPGSLIIMPFYSVMGTLWVKTNTYEKSKKAIENYLKGSTNQREKLKEIIRQIIKKEKKVALWGAGTLSAELIAETGLTNKDIVCLFDNDPKKDGKEMRKIPIFKPPLEVDYFKDKIQAVIIGSWSNQDEIYSRIRFLEDSGVKIYKIFPSLIERGSY